MNHRFTWFLIKATRFASSLAKQRETGEERFGSDANVDIPHNKNRASASEEREDYIWQIPLIIVVIVIIVIFIVTHFG